MPENHPSLRSHFQTYEHLFPVVTNYFIKHIHKRIPLRYVLPAFSLAVLEASSGVCVTSFEAELLYSGLDYVHTVSTPKVSVLTHLLHRSVRTNAWWCSAVREMNYQVQKQYTATISDCYQELYLFGYAGNHLHYAMLALTAYSQFCGAWFYIIKAMKRNSNFDYTLYVQEETKYGQKLVHTAEHPPLG